MSTKIAWKQGYRAKVSADVAYAEIERIRGDNGGTVLAEDVVEAARDPASPLHVSFQWNDRKAAHQWRLEQARSMIRSFTFVDAKSAKSAPAFLNIEIDDARSDNGRAYLPTAFVMSDPDLKRRAIEDALAGLKSWQKRHGAIAGFEPVHRAIERVSRSLKGSEKRVKL